MDTEFITAMEKIISSIKAAGYDPYEQLYGYISTGKEEYITRSGSARERIKKLDKQSVKEYVEKMNDGKYV